MSLVVVFPALPVMATIRAFSSPPYASARSRSAARVDATLIIDLHLLMLALSRSVSAHTAPFSNAISMKSCPS